MNIERCARRLTSNGDAIVALLDGVDDDQTRWKPKPNEWSLLEVLNHLVDEERADFRMRLDLVLHHPNRPWPPIDPVAWARDRNYNRRDLAESVDNFKRERQASVDWLYGLTNPRWDNAHDHPSAGMLTAKTLMLAWLAHDLLHIRQLGRLHWQFLNRQAQPDSIAYAGDSV